MRYTNLAAAAVVALGLAACGSTPYYDNTTSYSSSSDSNYYAGYGRVVGIESVPGSGGSTTGAGAVIGGVVGGVLGHQVGSGRGNDAATVAGAIGGAVVGNEVEKRRAASVNNDYRVDVRLDNGNLRTLLQDTIGDLRVGDRVRIAEGRAYRY